VRFDYARVDVAVTWLLGFVEEQVTDQPDTAQGLYARLLSDGFSQQLRPPGSQVQQRWLCVQYGFIRRLADQGNTAAAVSRLDALLQSFGV
jgi:hypothetical protein